MKGVDGLSVSLRSTLTVGVSVPHALEEAAPMVCTERYDVISKSTY